MATARDSDDITKDNWEDITRNSIKLTQKQKERLDAYLKACYNTVKLKERYCDVIDHRNYIENFVKTLVKKLGERFPFLAVQELLESGSFYRGTRILNTTEFDFLLILCLTCQVEIIKSKRNYELEIRFTDKSLLQNIKETLSKYNTSDESVLYGDNLLLSSFLPVLINTIHECHQELHNEGVISYKGKHYLKLSIDTLNALEKLRQLRDNAASSAHRDSYDRLLQNVDVEYKQDVSHIPELSPNDVILDAQEHGPSVRLRLYGPLGPTDIDLCFCIETSRTDTGRYIVVPIGDSAWTHSFYENPSTPKLDEHHKRILMVFKYILIECNKMNYTIYTLNSHKLKTHVLVHQDKCKQNYHHEDMSLAECFTDIACNIFEKCEMRMNSKEIEIKSYSFDEIIYNIPDIYFPGETVNVRLLWQPVMLLYTLIEVVKDVPTPPTHHTDITTIDHRLVLAELLTNVIMSGPEYKETVVCPLDIFNRIKSNVKDYMTTTHLQ